MFNRNKPTLRYKESKKIRLPVAELQLGMYVYELDCPWEETPFLFQGFRIEHPDELDKLRECCDEVVVDVQSSVDVSLSPGGSRGPARKARVVTTKVENVLPKATARFEQSSTLMRTIMDDIRLGKAFDTKQAKAAVEDAVDNILENPDAMTLLTAIRNKDEYTSEHSLSVSLLSITLGRGMGLERKQLVDLGLCGMMHDVGKLKTPLEILNKEGRLTDEEMDIMRAHTTHGRDILLSTDGLPPATIDVAHAHHERITGGGYPRGLTGDQLTEFTKMVSVVDTFDAITSDRCYDNSRTTMEAFRILTRERGISWESKLVVRFIDTIGIYPPGSVVKLSNGMIGVVLESHPTLKLRPKILLARPGVTDIDKFRMIDLAKVQKDGKGNALNIVDVLNPKAAGIDLQAIKATGVFNELKALQKTPD